MVQYYPWEELVLIDLGPSTLRTVFYDVRTLVDAPKRLQSVFIPRRHEHIIIIIDLLDHHTGAQVWMTSFLLPPHYHWPHYRHLMAPGATTRIAVSRTQARICIMYKCSYNLARTMEWGLKILIHGSGLISIKRLSMNKRKSFIRKNRMILRWKKTELRCGVE